MASPGTVLAPESLAHEVSFPSTVVAGLGWGLAMWWAYGAVEYTLLAAIPLFTSPQGVFNTAQWRLSGLLFGAYWALGALSGAAAGALVRNWNLRTGRPERPSLAQSRLPGTLGLLIAIQIHLITVLPIGAFAKLVFVLAFALTAGILWVLRHPSSRLIGFVEFNPFLLALLLILPTCLGTEGFGEAPLLPRVSIVLGTVAALIAANWLLSKARVWSAGTQFLATVAIMGLVVISCAFRSRSNQYLPPYTQPALADPGRPPVILVVFDTARADHLSINGYSRNTTPHLAQFAAGATAYTNIMAASNYTLPTHASMFTGVYPSWHGARSYEDPPIPQPLDGKLPTLAEILRSHGYATLASCSNSAYLVSQWGLNRGFDRFSVKRLVEFTQQNRRFQLRLGIRSLLGWTMQTAEYERVYPRADEVDDQAIALISQPAVRSRSFFLFANYMDAHVPYLPSEPFNRMFVGSAGPIPYDRQREVVQQYYRNGEISEAGRTGLIAQYDGGIAYADFAFSQLIEKLKSMGMYDRSLIIVTSDHGEGFGDHSGAWFHGNAVYQDEVDVPLLIKYPGQSAGAVVSTPASQVDLMPTILDTLGYPIPKHAMGVSLRNTDALEGRQLLAESVKGRALRWRSLKLIVAATGKRELYNLEQDPLEKHNLYLPINPESKLMDEAYAAWLRRIPNGGKKGSPVDPAEMRHLRGLGYIQ